VTPTAFLTRADLSITSRDGRYGHFIDGACAAPRSGKFFESLDPSTGRSLGEFARGDEADVDDAVSSAADGFARWHAMAPAERGRVLHRIADIIRVRAPELARIESIDSGKPLSVAHGEMLTSARYFEYFAGVADKILGEVIPVDDVHLLYTVREPYGVTAHILPWNAPMQVAARGTAPALAAGNSVVVKPAEHTCLTTLALAAICHEAGVPRGGFNVVTGYGKEAGAALVRHRGVRRISFTGSVATGRAVLHDAADRIVPATVELGGKSPVMVFADASLEQAVSESIKAFVANTGQICVAGTRLLVERSVLDEFTAAVCAALEKVTIGPGLDDPTIGPLVSREQLERVSRYVKIGIDEGAQLAFGGSRPQGDRLRDGFFFAPTVFTGATNAMCVAREEIFGPVACIIPFDDEEEAIQVANDTEYGLAAYVFTESIRRVQRLVPRLEVGQVQVNAYQPIGVEAPHGGYKESGTGREKGLEAIHHYTQLKSVAMRR
jgi:acyl-CoA reductase-like NAD-dependent aldehyde dehydrogenase